MLRASSTPNQSEISTRCFPGSPKSNSGPWSVIVKLPRCRRDPSAQRCFEDPWDITASFEETAKELLVIVSQGHVMSVLVK